MDHTSHIPFDPDVQNSSPDALIIAALERIAESFRVMLWEQAKEYGLSPIQVQSLIFLHTHDESKSTVTALAKEYNVTKATMSDVIKALSGKKLLIKKNDPADSRAQILRLTAQGKKIAEATGSFAQSLQKHISQLSGAQKSGLKTILFDLIHHLYREKIITVQRMCFTCTHFSSTGNKQFCHLLNMQLTAGQLRLDCPEHAEA